MAQKYPPASQFGPPVWGNKKLRERIKSSDIIQKLLKIESDSIISREDLCEKIDVDPAPFKSSNPEQRASFTYWFHQYLRVLRSMIDDYVKKEGIDGIMLLYPDIYSGDMDGEEPTETGGGPGIGLLLLRGARAIAAVLELRNRGVQAAIKRSIRTTYQLLTVRLHDGAVEEGAASADAEHAMGDRGAQKRQPQFRDDHREPAGRPARGRRLQAPRLQCRQIRVD
jgi:hypothetical protein